jgi:S-layer protein (TIGR01567 family)
MGKKVSVFTLVLVFLAVALPASGAITATNVEIRGTIASEDASAGGINLSANPASITWSPQSFTGFYYDLKDNLGTETLSIDTTASDSAGNFNAGGNRWIPKGALTYSTTGQARLLKVVDQQFPDNISGAISAGLEQAGPGQGFENGYYTILGWQMQPYVALNGKVDKLARLIIEQGTAASDKKTLQVGETWSVGGGWTLGVNSINNISNPKQVNLSLSKDGVEKNVTIDEGKIYTYVESSIANETNVPLFVTYVDSIFPTGGIVQLRYTWAVDTNVTEIRSSDTYGVFKNANVAGKSLTLKNDDTALTLTRDSTQDLMGNMKFRVADNDTLRFYPMVVKDQPGTYEVRGTIASEDASAGGINLSTNPASITWSPQNFVGFYYDSKDNLGTETLNIDTSVTDSGGAFSIYNRRIPKSAMTYSTTGQAKLLKVVDQVFPGNIYGAIAAGLEQAGSGRGFENGYYTMLGWQAQPYVALNGKVDQLSQLVIEQGTSAADKKTLTVGEAWNIGGGWTLTANSIDAKATPRQVWFTLSLNGVKKDDKVISQGGIYTYTEKSLSGETDVPVFLTYVDSVFAGATSDMVQLRYTWAISESVTHISSTDTYGVFKNANVAGKTLTLKNDDTSVTLSRNSTQDIMGEMKFKVADNDTLRFYPFVTYEISSPSPPSQPPSPPQLFNTLRFEPDAWNLVSTPKTLINPAVDVAFDNLSLDGNDLKWYYNAINITWEHPSDITPLKGYWVYNNASYPVFQKLSFKNMSGPNVPPSMTLKAGWNLIGHTATDPIPVQSALRSIDGKYSHLLTYDPVQGWKMYIVGNPDPAFQQFNVLERGRGYWIFMTQDSTYAAVSV